MNAETIRLVFVAFFILELGWDLLLTLLNLRHVRRHANSVPDAFAAVVDRETYARSVSYTLVHGRFGMADGVFSAVVILAVVFTGALGWIESLTRSLPVPAPIKGIFLIAAVGLVFSVLQLPFTLYSTFGIEARFGFNKTTPRLWIIDALKGLGITVVLGVPLLLALFWFMRATGAFWWIWAFGAMTAFQLVMNILSPLVIAPLFNKFTPLPESILKEAILALATKLGFRTKGIFVVDSSRRSRHSNAYFTGLGRSKRIVLYDTLVSSHTESEIVSVLAHEIGHEKRNHIKKGIVVSTLVSLIGFWILSLLVPWQPLYAAFGFIQASPAALLVILSLCSGPFTFFLQPLFTARSRRQEYEADRFAVKGVGSAAGMKAALLRLSKDNLSNLTPHPLYSFCHYSHPTLAERIAALEKAEKALAPS